MAVNFYNINRLIHTPTPTTPEDAVKFGTVAQIKAFLAKDDKQKPYLRVKLVSTAFECEKPEVIRLLLETGELNSTHMGTVALDVSQYIERKRNPFTNAAAEAIADALTRNKEITPDAQFDVLKLCAKLGNREQLIQALAKRTFSKQEFSYLASYALCSQTIDNYLCLLQHCPDKVDFRGHAVDTAAHWGDLELIQFILQDGPISEEHRERAIISAADYGHLDVLKWLMEKGPISVYARGQIIACCARNLKVTEIMPLIKTLLADGPITMFDRGDAVSSHALRGNLQIIEMLLANGPITDKSRARAIITAITSQRILVEISPEVLSNLIRTLLKSGPISHDSRIYAAAIAVDRDFGFVLDELFPTGLISDQNIGEIMEKSKNRQQAALLLANYAQSRGAR